MTEKTPLGLEGAPVEIVIDLGNGFTQITRMDIEHRDDLSESDEPVWQ